MAESLTDDRLEVRITRATGSETDEARSLDLNPVGARWVGSGLHSLA